MIFHIIVGKVSGKPFLSDLIENNDRYSLVSRKDWSELLLEEYFLRRNKRGRVCVYLLIFELFTGRIDRILFCTIKKSF